MEEAEADPNTRNEATADSNGEHHLNSRKSDAKPKPKSPKGGAHGSKHSTVAEKKGEAGKRRRKKVKSRKVKMENSSDASNQHSSEESDDSSTASSDSDAEETSSGKNGLIRSSRKSKGKKKTAKAKKGSHKRKSAKAEKLDTDSDTSSDSDSDDQDGSNSSNEALQTTAALADRLASIEESLSSMGLQRVQDSLNTRNNSDPTQQVLYNAGYNTIVDSFTSQHNQPVYPQRAHGLQYFAPRGVTSVPQFKAIGSQRTPSQKPDKKRASKVKSSRPDFRRVDWVWDSTHYTHRLQDTAETVADSQYEGYVFHVRRTFDHEGRYLRTIVDIKSKLLRECLQDVIKNVQGISLVDETPKLDPNLLFLYVEDLRTHLRALKWLEPAGETRKERKKNQKRLDDKREHLRVLVKYLDKDYADIKSCIEPMLQSGLITYDYLWALWKPGTLVYSHTYGHNETPRVFKVNTAERHQSMIKGDFYYIDGKYLEYDGKRFGYGSMCEEVPEFRGAKKITSLPCYPLAFRKDEAKIRESLIERGKKFVALGGVHFKAYSGMAFLKRKKGILKFNIANSRIMVDPAIFRRINPNYVVSPVKPKSHDVLTIEDDDDSDDDGSGAGCGCDTSDDEEGGGSDQIAYVTKIFKDDKNQVHMVRMRKDSDSDEEVNEELGELPESKGNNEEAARDDTKGEGKVEDKDGNDTSRSDTKSYKSQVEVQDETKTTGTSPSEEIKEGSKRQLPSFTDEEYLIASPLVLGFSFGEKQWLEFDVAKVKEIKWNENAWDSLVLKPDTKDLIRALVESRKYNAANTIDDVIQGKGKGLVTVLHGPPGTGKTLTAEGISELLKCPLYMASAGELGTDSRFLEHELQKILDICHTWGAILLLDEADVFLEKRNMQDIHRNALVSVFLRQLEYFQGILFLTTNRVETFDEAFQSRIHIALRYDKLDPKAKRTIFKLFIDRVEEHGKLEVHPFTEEDLRVLSKHDLNGREIKNVMGSAQDMAINKGEALSMRHIKLVLDVHAKFGQDLKGGSGFEDAMRSYF